MKIRLKEVEKVRIGSSDDIYRVMRRILMRENRIDRDREHLWTISLDSACKILNIELVSFGSVKTTVVEPMEVFSIPLQKRAVHIVLVHNHPSGEITPSDADEDVTDQLIQVGRIMQVPVLDHLIITENSYYSFNDSGLLAELQRSLKYVPAYEIQNRMDDLEEKVSEAEKARNLAQQVADNADKDAMRKVARQMKKEGYELSAIVKLTGLSESEIVQL